MNIGITSFGADGGKSGISQYVIQLLRQFATQDKQLAFELYLYDSERHLFPCEGQVSPIGMPDRIRPPLANLAWHQLSLGRWCRKQNHDVLFLPAGNRRLPYAAPCPTVGTVHDFSSLHVRGKYDWARTTYIRHVLPRMIRRLTRVLTVSESSKRDIVEYAGVAPEHVTVAPLAVDHDQFYPREREETVDRLRQLLATHPLSVGESPMILYISRLEHPGKNHVRLIEAFNQLKRRLGIPHQLLLVGSDWNRAEAIHQAAATSPYSNDIVLPGFVPSDVLPLLYNLADLHVFPSLYEGFGLPILEAMASGAPTACSDCSSLPEVAGNAADLFDPYDVDSIAASMERLLTDSAYRQILALRGINRAEQFSWQRTAQQTLQVLEEASQC